MTDVQVDETVEQTETTEAPAEKPAKAKVEPHDCLCSTFLLLDPNEPDAEFDTGCSQTTLRTFAQGHDARLVSFLVAGHFDGYTIAQRQADGTQVAFDGPGHAAATASEALGVKADKATANAQAKVDAKAQRDAAKEAKKAEREAEKAKRTAEKEAAKEAKKAEAKPPREVGAKVRQESVVDDGPVVDPQVGDRLIVKVGRGEYEADVVAGEGDLEGKPAVNYLNIRGEEETRDLELVRVLRRA